VDEIWAAEGDFFEVWPLDRVGPCALVVADANFYKFEHVQLWQLCAIQYLERFLEVRAEISWDEWWIDYCQLAR
jgi:hypothetical protein